MAENTDWRARLKRLREAHAQREDDDDAEMLLLTVVASCTQLVSAEGPPKKRGGSRPGRSPNAKRDHADGHRRLYLDYFGSDPVYNARLFRRRFRMPTRVFDRLMNGVLEMDDYFRQKPDVTGKLGLSPLQKVTAVLRMYRYGVAADATDEYVRLGETTATEAFQRFTKAVLNKFGSEYLREPTAADIQHHTRINEQRGFPGMFGSLDCTHWTWKDCPVAWQGMYQDKDGVRSVIMEAVATQNLWIWHSYIGLPSSNNDINVVDRSPFMVNWLKGNAPSHSYTVNDNAYSMCYLLCDGIYPEWSVFVKTISNPSGEKEKLYAKTQEGMRKDVERCFGVLQGRFAILARTAPFLDQGLLNDVWYACVVMHNMIIEAEEEEDEQDDYIERVTLSSVASGDITFDSLLIIFKMKARTLRCVTI
ncbi:hypothetical protein PF005_g21073 [Phytophthora fragariae]|uniref:DDE Tnp4 domain-containing protein n=1 Tax=Phytophthora fragariae TaxID=53985 RepID=A0A6A4CF73_9STRA|nr:hypothetical protein PF003_g19294 [Phytophthora fragariae]KAE8927815.1 hypothetical protein PF009_g22026 [Phytophthora fragariae]KAE8986856.1 hypothetical protein PF011_g19821 [Phytophthora fragariae]KAE9109995.1 hypothetical protein PF010_g11333 [Phytophthora fragariae]KAE9111996.1 hypothetical protein PF006_g20082 [Phytophthora fragariae]